MSDFNELNLFVGRCGHRWVGAIGGSYACPVCGVWDGDHNICGGPEVLNRISASICGTSAGVMLPRGTAAS
jgi:hypothetical protein